MKNKIFVTICILLMYSMAHSGFMWPIAMPKRITGTFGEYRGRHYHHGIDISCGRKKGRKILAAGDGYISTVMYQQWGIGYALFIKHRNGYYTMYGHLDRFSPFILKNKTVKQYQKYILNRKDFRIDFDRPAIKVKRGRVIAYSGDSGIGWEHFHFEVRLADNEPVNPLAFGLTVADKKPPSIRKIFLKPLGPRSHVNGKKHEAEFKVAYNRKKKQYYLKTKKNPVVAGIIGIKIEAYDRVGYKNRVALYEIEMYNGKKRIYNVAFNRIVRKDSHRIGLDYDYDRSSLSRYTYFLYNRISRKGSISPGNGKGLIPLKIVCHDAAENRSVMTLSLVAGEKLKNPAWKGAPNLVPGEDLALKSKDRIFTIDFDEKSSLYRERITLNTEAPYKSALKNISIRSRVYSVKPTDLSLDSAARIEMKYSGDDYQKIGVYKFSRSGRYFYCVGKKYNTAKKKFTLKTWRMGRFFLARDDAPPRIRFRKRKKILPRKSIRIYVSDIGCGIDLMRVYLIIDGNNADWDYDPDRRCIEILPHNKIWGKGKHVISIRIFDRAGNSSPVKKISYTIKK